MEWVIVSIFFLLLSWLSYRNFHSFVSPSTLLPFVWGVLLILYNVFPSDLYPLSHRFYIVLVLWVISFFFASFLFSRVRVPSLLKQYNHINRSVLSIYYIICSVSIPLIIFQMLKMGGTNLTSFFYKVRMAQIGLSDEGDYGILRYSMTLIIVLFLIELYRRKTTKERLKMLFLFNLVCIIATMAKVQIFWLIFPSIFILVICNRLTKKLIFWGLGGCLFLFFLLQILRGSNGDESVIGKFMYEYLLGGMPALDQIIQSDIQSNEFGYYTLSFFRKVLGVKSSPNSHVLLTIFNDGIPGWAYVPYPTNVFTALYAPYLDFGIIGIAVFGLIIGIISGLLYKLALKKIIWGVIGYSYIFAAICFQFFADGVFMLLSQFIQFCFIPWFLCYISKNVVVGNLFSFKQWSK